MGSDVRPPSSCLPRKESNHTCPRRSYPLSEKWRAHRAAPNTDSPQRRFNNRSWKRKQLPRLSWDLCDALGLFLLALLPHRTCSSGFFAFSLIPARVLGLRLHACVRRFRAACRPRSLISFCFRLRLHSCAHRLRLASLSRNLPSLCLGIRFHTCVRQLRAASISLNLSSLCFSLSVPSLSFVYVSSFRPPPPTSSPRTLSCAAWHYCTCLRA